MNKNFGTELYELIKKYDIESIESPMNAYSKISISKEKEFTVCIQGFKFNGKDLKAEEVLGDDVYLIFNLKDQNAESS